MLKGVNVPLWRGGANRVVAGAVEIRGNEGLNHPGWTLVVEPHARGGDVECIDHDAGKDEDVVGWSGADPVKNVITDGEVAGGVHPDVDVEGGGAVGDNPEAGALNYVFGPELSLIHI